MLICYNFRKLIIYSLNMATKVTIETIKHNADVTKKTIVELKNELNILNTDYNNIRAEQLRQENAKLLEAVEEAKKKLIDLEIKNGVKQILVPNQINSKTEIVSTKAPEPQPSKAINCDPEPLKENKPKKEKKAKEVKEKSSAETESPIDVGRLDLRIAKIEDVQKHPDADSLYVLKIDCGEEKPRTVCSGLVKYVPIDDLKDRLVMLLCNLKPVKMRGITSEAMVMCASTSEAVEVLIPPLSSLPGEKVECDGYIRKPDAVMNPKKKIFETVCPDLHTNDKLQACYKGSPFSVIGKGPILSKTLKNVPVK